MKNQINQVAPGCSAQIEANVFQQYIDYQDTDAGGVVYHGCYLNFAERARAKLFRETMPQEVLYDYLWVVKTLQAEYKAPAKLGDQIKVITTVLRFNWCSIDFRQEVWVEDGLKVFMRVKLVSLNKEFKIVQFTPDIKDALTTYLTSEGLGYA